jgi:transposase
MKEVYYVGLDIHKDSIQMAVLDSWKKEPVLAKGLPNKVTKIVKELAVYQEKGEVQIAYEAGCLGYTLYRELEKFGYDCRVIPPNTVFHGGDGQVKTDSRDAIDIAWMLRRNEGESITIPTKEDEATRDLVRCRGYLMENLKLMKQRLLKFPLGKGVNYETDRYWTGKHYKWLSGVKFENVMEQLTKEEYLEEIRRIEEKVGRLDKKIEEVAESERYADEEVPGVSRDRLPDSIVTCVRGRGLQEVSERGGVYVVYRLVPSEQSSGKKRKQGRITKCGNGHLRKLLTESSWHYTRPNQVGKRLERRREGTDERTIRYADKAMKRPREKYTRLIFKGKSKQTAVIAVARELAGFIWGVMNMAA